MSSGADINAGDTAHNANTMNTATPNTRAYNASKHNEFNEPVFHGQTTFGDTTNYHFGRKKDAQTREFLENLVATKVDWSILSRQLSVVDQGTTYRSTYVPVDQNSPDFPWVTKNIDFTKWESDEKQQALWLSGACDAGTKEVSSQVIYNAKKKATQSNGCVLYFFCATATESRDSIATVFVHTLLHQIVGFSGDETAQAITTTFLTSLLDGHIRRSLSGFKKDDPLVKTVERILDAPSYDLHIALINALAKAGPQHLSLIIDGISIAAMKGDVFVRNVSLLVNHMIAAGAVGAVGATRFKALLTSSQYSELKGFLGDLPSIQFRQEREEILRLLQDHDGTRYGNITRQHGGSLEWLWQNAEYRNWEKSTTSKLLYIEGKPGSGKSTLVKYFESNLAEKVPDSTSATVAYYFYTLRGTTEEAKHANMLRAILHSILTQDESVFHHFQTAFRHFRYAKEWPYESLKSILSSLVDHISPKPLYLILDAMDESMEEDRTEIVELLCKLCSAKGFRVKAFVASRPVADLNLLFTEWRHSMHVIRLQHENYGDICTFTDTFLTKLGLSEQILLDTGKYIKANAEGVFVWVHLVKAELTRLRSTGLSDMQLSHQLKCLPRKLEEFYKHMLDRLEREGRDDEVQDGITLVQFVLFSSRPLNVVELQHVLAFQAMDCDSSVTPPHIKFQRHLSDAIEARIAHCGGNFLDITADGTVQLMHQTAREFFLQIKQHKPDSKFYLSSQKTHGAIATTSVQYLMLCLGNPETSMKDTLSDTKGWGSNEFQRYAKYLNEWPLITYAIFNVYYHLGLCDTGKRILHLVKKLIKKLSSIPGTASLGRLVARQHKKKKSILTSIRDMASRTPLRKILPESASDDFVHRALDAAAELHMLRVFELLRSTHMHTLDEVLLISCVRKRLAAASRELIKGVEKIDGVDMAGKSALHHAVENGDLTIARLLKDAQASSRLRDNHGNTPVDIAVKL